MAEGGASAGAGSSGASGGAAAPSGGAAPASGGQSAGAPSGAGTSAPTQQPTGSAAPNGGQPQATRTPVMVKHRAKIGDQEHDLEIDIAEHLASHKHKFRADGQDHEVTVADLIERAPLMQATWRRMQTATETTKKAEAAQRAQLANEQRLVQALSDPETALHLVERALGGEQALLRAMEARAARHLAEQKMTPEQRAEREAMLRQRDEDARRSGQLTEREKNIQEREAALQKAESDRLYNEFAVNWPKALAVVGLPQTKATMQAMSRVKIAAKRAGYDMSDAEAAREVREEAQALLAGIPADQLRSVAPATAAAIAQQQVAELNANAPGRVAPSQQPAAGRPRQQPEQKQDETWDEMVDRRRREADERFHGAQLRRQG